MTAPEDHPTKLLIKYELATNATSRKSPISNMVRLEDFEIQHTSQCEIIQPFPTPPWDNPVGELINLDLDRDEAKEQVLSQVADEETNGAMVVLTDGSLGMDGGGGLSGNLQDRVAKPKLFTGRYY